MPRLIQKYDKYGIRTWEMEKDWGAIMRRTIMVLELATILILMFILFTGEKAEAIKEPEGKYFLMNCTAYSRHKNCIADKWNDGFTATMTPIREGIVAINVDMIDGEWIIKSPLKLGDNIYIEGMGNYVVEDTGRFAERDHKQDCWTIDIYMDDYEKAVNFGRQIRKIYVLND